MKAAVISKNHWPPSMVKYKQLVQVNSEQDKPSCFHWQAFLWKQLFICLQFPLQYSPVCKTTLHLKWVQSCSRGKASLGGGSKGERTHPINAASWQSERLPGRWSGGGFAQRSSQQHCWWEYKHKDGLKWEVKLPQIVSHLFYYWGRAAQGQLHQGS